MSNRNRLLQLLKENSLLFGDFTLTSGKKSSYYFDSKLTTLLPEGSYLVAREILRIIDENKIQADAIGGLTLGADPIVSAVAAVSFMEKKPLPAFIVRKDPKGHGSRRRIEGNVRDNAKVIIVDDVVTTAGSTLSAIEAAKEAGFEIVAVICLVDREEGGAVLLKPYNFYPIFRRSEILPS
ncbi:MAG: orotate phosphoribosyltransferase [Acidobacteriota bacterium]